MDRQVVPALPSQKIARHDHAHGIVGVGKKGQSGTSQKEVREENCGCDGANHTNNVQVWTGTGR
jgi:hypothetical protein